MVGFTLVGVAPRPAGFWFISTGFWFISKSENVSLFAKMGVIVLLFVTGMELSIKAFVLSLRQAVLIAGGQVVAAVAAGLLMAQSIAVAPMLVFVIGLGGTPAYGAFMAGIVIGTSTLPSRIIPVIEPIQSVMLVVFLLSIGLLIDLTFIGQSFRTVLNVFLLRRTGRHRRSHRVCGRLCAQRDAEGRSPRLQVSAGD